MKFYDYASDENSSSSIQQQMQLRLCYMTNKSCLQCLKLINEDQGFMLECSIQCVQDKDALLNDNRVYMMAFKNDYVATIDTDQNLNIWCLKTQQNLCALPHYERLTACMCFHPEKNYLLVCYANRKIIEYDFIENEFTDWSRETSDKFPKQWSKLHTKLLSCFYDTSDMEKIVCYDEQYLVVINKREKMPLDQNAKIFQQQMALQSGRIKSLISGQENSEEMEELKNSNCALHISNKYRYIVHINEPIKGHLLIVEVTPLTISEKLPPSLKQKKFGFRYR
jgi:U3 small nucleolar RNA-associated protein 4